MICATTQTLRSGMVSGMALSMAQQYQEANVEPQVHAAARVSSSLGGETAVLYDNLKYMISSSFQFVMPGNTGKSGDVEINKEVYKDINKGLFESDILQLPSTGVVKTLSYLTREGTNIQI